MDKRNNYYELLGVSYTASKEEIKKAYLALLKQYHPDIFKGSKKVAEEFSANLNVAYDTLSNPEKRLAYDKSIFTSGYVWNYCYDEKGLRVTGLSSVKETTLPKFSFFKESVHSKARAEKKAKAHQIKVAKAQEKLEKKQKQLEKKQQNYALKQKMKEMKRQEKIDAHNLKLEKKKANIRTELDKQNKAGLNAAILILSLIIVGIFAFLAYLNLTYGN